MVEENKQSVMRRKAGAGRPPPEIGRMTPARMLRSAIAQAAEDSLGLIAKVLRVDERRTSLTAFAESLPENALLILCEGPEDQFAMVVLDAECMAALIEVQTTGRVIPSPANPRAPTRTDALLAADFIDLVLELFETGAAEAELPLAAAIAGYRYALPLADTRAMLMTLVDAPYRLFEMQIDLGEGAKEGQMIILMPLETARPAAGASNAAWQQDLFEAVKGTHVELQAVLARKRMSLREVSQLCVGATITLPREVVSRVQIEGLDGAGVSFGRLGQSGGFRAICIDQPGAEVAPELAALNNAATGLDQPAQPAPGALPDLPDIPDLPSLGDGADLAGLSDLDLAAELPDLPQLSGLGG